MHTQVIKPSGISIEVSSAVINRELLHANIERNILFSSSIAERPQAGRH